jgi:hypothetical protein
MMKRSYTSINNSNHNINKSLDFLVGDLSATKKWLLNGNKDQEFDKRDPSNHNCFECNKPGATWISVNNGIFICINCAGIHRGFGVQISFVRSLEMDNITDL